MKIRTSFVSNSSSSSFSIYGIYMEDCDMEKVLSELGMDTDGMNLYDWLEDKEKEKVFKERRIGSHGGPDNYCAVGRSWDTIGDDETGKQFKEKVEKGIKEVFGDKIKCATHEDAWRDG